MKKCPDCGEMKPLTHFYKGASYCKTCVGRRSKEYRLNNPEKVKEYNRKYGTSDKGKHKAKEIRENNIEHYRAKVNQWYKDHPESSRNRGRKYAANLTDSYVKKKLRRSGIKNPTPEQIEQRRNLILARRVKHALKPKLNSCRQCLHCGIFFKFKPGGRNQDGGKYCSPYCASLAKRTPTSDGSKYKPPSTKVAFIECSWCGKLFCSRGAARLCSDECRRDKANVLIRARSIDAHPIVNSKCKHCGKYFVKFYGQGNNEFCSDSCRKLNNRKAHDINKALRRARERTDNCEPVDPLKVFERDNYICQICGCQTPITFRGSWLPYAPELDHIIPLSKGGEHTYKNTQCACRACNQSKGNKIYVEPQRTQTRYYKILSELRQADRA